MRAATLNRLAFEHAAANPTPNASYLQCPHCGEIIHKTLAEDGRYPEIICAEIENCCWQHFINHHRLRFFLHRKTGWRWFLLKGMG